MERYLRFVINDDKARQLMELTENSSVESILSDAVSVYAECLTQVTDGRKVAFIPFDFVSGDYVLDKSRKTIFLEI